MLYHLYHDYIALIAGLRIRIHCLQMDPELNPGQAFLEKSLGSKSNPKGQNAAFCKKIVNCLKFLVHFLQFPTAMWFLMGKKVKMCTISEHTVFDLL